MEYKPRSFQEQISEIIGKQKKRGYWECLNCEIIEHSENVERVLKKSKGRKHDVRNHSLIFYGV